MTLSDEHSQSEYTLYVTIESSGESGNSPPYFDASEWASMMPIKLDYGDTVEHEFNLPVA